MFFGSQYQPDIGSSNYCVARPGNDFLSFSEDGDSGAVVYTEDLMIVGFIVAGTSQGYSLLHVVYDCLASLGVNPL